MTVKSRESPYQARLGIQVFFGGFKGIPVFIEVSQETAKIRIPASSLPESNHVLQGAVQFLLLKVYFLVGYGHVFPKPICFFFINILARSPSSRTEPCSTPRRPTITLPAVIFCWMAGLWAHLRCTNWHHPSALYDVDRFLPLIVEW